MKQVDVTNAGKLVGLLLAVIGCFATIIVIVIKGGATTETVAVMAPVGSLLTLLIGYIVGNGSGAKQGFVSVPPFQPTPSRQAEILTKIMAEDLPFKEKEQVERLVQRTKEVEEGH